MHLRNGRRQGQAHGLTWPLRVRKLEAVGDRLIDDRNRALLAVAYDAMLRRSELTSLNVSDLLEEITSAVAGPTLATEPGRRAGGGLAALQASPTDRCGMQVVVRHR